MPGAAHWARLPQRTALALYALGAAHFGIGVAAAAHGCVWAWIEAQASVAVRAVPLGHAAAQRMVHALAPRIPAVVARGLALADAVNAGATIKIDDTKWVSVGAGLRTSFNSVEDGRRAFRRFHGR